MSEPGIGGSHPPVRTSLRHPVPRTAAVPALLPGPTSTRDTGSDGQVSTRHRLNPGTLSVSSVCRQRVQGLRETPTRRRRFRLNSSASYLTPHERVLCAQLRGCGEYTAAKEATTTSAAGPVPATTTGDAPPIAGPGGAVGLGHRRRRGGWLTARNSHWRVNTRRRRISRPRREPVEAAGGERRVVRASSRDCAGAL